MEMMINEFYKIGLIAGFSMVCMTGCIDSPVEDPLPISEDLNLLSYHLLANKDCAHKREFLEKWLNEKSSRIDKNLAGFKKKCEIGKNDYMQCMSHQILAAARVEVALGDCRDDADMRKAVERLNQKAGIAIGMTRD